ncbi:MAG: hypothetical protein NTY96_10710 [Bacteroidetes bacterium]|nr:hypothetical protein [Bacteroidota bacterium]
MRRIFKILVVILVYFIASAKSCDDQEQNTRESEQQEATKARDSIVSVFEKENLSPSALRAFEVTAGLKLNDLSDYLKIMNDSTAGKAFKDKAGEMAEALFIPGTKAPADLAGVVFDSIRVSRALNRVSDSVYSGQLSFAVTLSHSIKAKGNIHRVETRIVDIFTLKQEKAFGKEKIKVWKVFLGDIK